MLPASGMGPGRGSTSLGLFRVSEAPSWFSGRDGYKLKEAVALNEYC